MSDDATEALPPRARCLRILVVEDHANMLRVLPRLLDHFGMNMLSIFVIQAKWCEANSRELSLTSMPMEKDCRRPLLT